MRRPCLDRDARANARRALAEWPDKPVRVIVPYSAGGANDLLGRVFAEQLSKTFNQQFFVENRTGGGGLIGTAAVARAAPDGYTLEISGMPSHVLAPAMNKNASFDPIKDFTHIAYLGGPPNVFVVHPSLGINSFKELIALMKSRRMACNTSRRASARSATWSPNTSPTRSR